MRPVQFALLAAIFSTVIYVLVSWYIWDGPTAVTNSYSFANDTLFPGGKMENLFWFVQVINSNVQYVGEPALS